MSQVTFCVLKSRSSSFLLPTQTAHTLLLSDCNLGAQTQLEIKVQHYISYLSRSGHHCGLFTALNPDIVWEKLTHSFLKLLRLKHVYLNQMPCDCYYRGLQVLPSMSNNNNNLVYAPYKHHPHK